MSTVTRPKRRLPARVYWTRRVLVLGIALALVFGISHLLGSSPDESDNPSARPAAATAASTTTGTVPASGPTGNAATTGEPKRRKKNRNGTALATPLAVPTGLCADSDVRVTPSVDGRAYAGQNVTITLNLTAVESPACTWMVSPDSVVVKLTSGDDRIWSTQDCASAIESGSVVVRKDNVTKVGVTWSGQRSDDECTRTPDWAQPGYYHAAAAALGAEPEVEQFELLTPTPPTITATPKVAPRKPKASE